MFVEFDQAFFAHVDEFSGQRGALKGHELGHFLSGIGNIELQFFLFFVFFQDKVANLLTNRFKRQNLDFFIHEKELI